MDNLVRQNREVITKDQRHTIKQRYETITKAINKEFWYSTSERDHSLYVGSYGRGTAINTSDIDILVTLPREDFDTFNSLKGNSQSKLLQAVRSAILNSYPLSEVHADGQVVVIDFSDGIKFEVLPAFEQRSIYGETKFIYPDTHKGGRWLSTNPKAEQDALAQKNRESNGLLFDTCKHIRYIRDEYFSELTLKGIVIDTFVYNSMFDWHWLPLGEKSTQPSGTYEQILYNRLDAMPNSAIIQVPGSNDSVSVESSYYCLRKVLAYMARG